MALFYLPWSLLSYAANELEQACEWATRALHLAERADIADGIIWGRGILSHVHLANGELGAARQVAQEGRQYASCRDV